MSFKNEILLLRKVKSKLKPRFDLIPIYQMRNSPSDNLSEFMDEPVVFDDKRSDVRTQTGHRISFVFPSWIGQKDDEFQTVIINGEVLSLKYELGQENDNPVFSGSFKIHDEKFPCGKDISAMHAQGTASLKKFKSGNFRTVVGADSPCKPKTVYLAYADVRLDTKLIPVGEHLQLAVFQALLNKVNAMTGRSIVMVPEPSAIVIRLPATWILQDLTAIAKATNRDPTTATPVIKKPIAFPCLRSRVCLNRDGRPSIYIIEDFEIVGGTKVEVLLVDLQDRTNSSFLTYSQVYAATEKELLNPLITRVVSPHQTSPFLDSHRTEAMDMIQKNLSRWGLWKICDEKKGFKVMVEPLNGAVDSWLLTNDALKSPNHKIISFESGVVVSPSGERKNVVASLPENDDPEGSANVVELQNIPEDCKIESLVFNAVIGNAEAIVGGKKTELYFAAKNGQDISFDKVPLFAPVTCAGRPIVDVINDQWFLGVPGKSVEKKHAAKTVLRWVSITPAFRHFYLWVVSSGKNPMFKGKTADEIRALISCPRFPQILEMFNFMILGLHQGNPTRLGPWTTAYCRDILCLDMSQVV